MVSAIIANLEKLLNGPRDGALLRYSPGTKWLKVGDAAKAAECCRAAVDGEPKFAGAWNPLGKAPAAPDAGEASADAAARREAFPGLALLDYPTIARSSATLSVQDDFTLWRKQMNTEG